MKTIFFKSNLLHIRTNEGDFEVSNPEVVHTSPLVQFHRKWNEGDESEWPGGVELIDMLQIRVGNEWKNLLYQKEYKGNMESTRTIKLARLLPPKEENKICIASHGPASTQAESAYKEFEKPDFFKMAIDRNLYLAAPEAAEMCEIVWNTHVVPLQEQYNELCNHSYKQAGEIIRLMKCVADDAFDLGDEKRTNENLSRYCHELQSENKALREENTRLTTKFIEEEHAADHPNENLSYWQYQQFTRAAITKLKEEISQLKAEVLKEKFPEN